MDDTSIVELYLSRSEKAINETQKKYGDFLRNLAFNIVKDHQTAEECENDTYLQAWDSIPPHEPKSYLFAFLARITRNLSLNCCRNRNRLKRNAFICELSAEMEQCIPAPDDVACRIDEIAFGKALNGFLSIQSPQKRIVFLRRYWYLDSISTIAKRYGLRESTVKTMLFRIRKNFKKYLEQEGYIL